MRKIIVALLIISILCLTFSVVLPACKKQDTSFTISLVGSVISWNKVQGASSYTVCCTFPDGSGYEVKVTGTEYTSNITASGDYNYYVKAMKGSKQIVRSNSVLYHLGKGNQIDPITIGSVAELKAIKTGTHSVYFGTTKLTAPLHYVLTNDIDLGGEEWTPIGNKSDVFSGSFNGNNHTISNFKITKATTGGWTGFFGNCQNAEITGLTLNDCSITFDKTSGVSGDNCVGLLVGYAGNCIIENCVVNGEISVLKSINTITTSSVCSGGLVGRTQNTKILRSSFVGKNYVQYGVAEVGGLVGETSTKTDAISNCFANAEVEAVGTNINATTGEVTAKAYAGTLVGYANYANKISSCVVLGTSLARSIHDGAKVAYITSGVFGGTLGHSSTNSIPIYDIFYAKDGVKGVSGNRTTLCDSGENFSAYPLKNAELSDINSYKKNTESESLLDFDSVWELVQGAAPSLRRVNRRAPITIDLNLVSAEDNTNDFAYDLTLFDTFNPQIMQLYLDKEMAYYKMIPLANVLTGIGIDKSTVSSVTITATGITPITLETNSDFDKVYVAYAKSADIGGIYTNFENAKIINGATSAVYNMKNGKITITVTIPKTEN